MMWIFVVFCFSLFVLQVCCQTSSDPGQGKGPPSVIQARAGADVVLNCDVASKIQDIYLLEWRMNGSKSPIFMKFMKFQNPHVDSRYSRRLHIVNNSAILISGVKVTDSGMYSCRIIRSGSTSFVQIPGTPVVLRIKGDTSVKPSRRKTVAERYPAVLDCLTETTLSQTSNHFFTWSKDGVDIKKDDARLKVLQSGALFIRSSQRTDSGVYACTAKTFDSSGLVTYPGAKILLDVQFRPVIVSIMNEVSAPEASDARLPCVSKGNPATSQTNWTLDGYNVLLWPRFIVLQKGTLLIRNVKRSDVGSYKCTPINSVGVGTSMESKLVIKILPTFTLVPPAILTVRTGDTIKLKCAAVSEMVPNVYWERKDKPLPEKRTLTSGGNLTIVNVKKGDHGVYNCIASTANGKATHPTIIAVMSTPGRPTITSVRIEDDQSNYRSKRSTVVSAFVTWRPGYDGGSPQRFEVWYRAVSQKEYQWKHSKLLSADVTSYRVKDLLDGEVYLFSVRGINKEGSGSFSLRKKAGPGIPPDSSLLRDINGTPLPPTDVTVNITASGYYVYWSYNALPGRPEVDSFKIQYVKVNKSVTWITAAPAIPYNQQMYLLKAEIIDEGTEYDFRVFASAGSTVSSAAYVSKRFLIAAPILGKRASVDETLPIVAGVIGAVVLLVVIGLACFCFVQWKAKKKRTEKEGKKVHFILPDGATEPYGDQEFDDEFCDPEIKLRPETVRFVPDDSEGSEDEKINRRQKKKPDDLLMLTSSESRPYGGQMLRYQVLVSESPNNKPNADSPLESPVSDRVVFFGDYESKDGLSAWYDCSLTRPACREVRDSYDQFCRSPTEVGSRDSIDTAPHRKRALYEQKGSKIDLVKKFDSNGSLQDKREPTHSRVAKFKTIAEEGSSDDDALRVNGNLKRTRKLPAHHWSTPAVFMAQESQHCRDSDTDSGDSLRRGRKARRVRPHSLYCNSLDTKQLLNDQRSKLQCICEHGNSGEKQRFETLPKTYSSVKRAGSDVSDRETSYLHLEKRNSFLDQLKSWDSDSESGAKSGKPYDGHERRTGSDSDSEHSISPAHSLVSLSDSESDKELAKSFQSSKDDAGKRLSFVGEANQTHLFRTASFLKGVDSESASDGNFSDYHDKTETKQDSTKTIQNVVPQSAIKADNSITEKPDSSDERKLCDPFFRPPHKVSRTPSNASSGIYSLQVSSSETNSVESYSPRESRRGPCLSGGSSFSSGYGSSRNSFESQGMLNSRRSNKVSGASNRHSFPQLNEPYEWDASGLEDMDTEGISYHPKKYEELLALQKLLGVELDSSSSNEELRNDSLRKLTTSDLLKLQPKVSPVRYKVDLLSDDEKDKRCSKLMAEYKTTKGAPIRKSPRSTVYRTWHL